MFDINRNGFKFEPFLRFSTRRWAEQEAIGMHFLFLLLTYIPLHASLNILLVSCRMPFFFFTDVIGTIVSIGDPKHFVNGQKLRTVILEDAEYVYY